MSKTNTIYLAGKITGDDDYKGKFLHAELKLTELGYIVMNPAILPPDGFEYDEYMRITEAMMRECYAVCLLPDWKKSNGAIQEYHVAFGLGKMIYNYEDLLFSGKRRERKVATWN